MPEKEETQQQDGGSDNLKPVQLFVVRYGNCYCVGLQNTKEIVKAYETEDLSEVMRDIESLRPLGADLPAIYRRAKGG